MPEWQKGICAHASWDVLLSLSCAGVGLGLGLLGDGGGDNSTWICFLISIGIPIVEIKRSGGCLISIMGFSILGKIGWDLYIKSGALCVQGVNSHLCDMGSDTIKLHSTPHSSTASSFVSVPLTSPSSNSMATPHSSPTSSSMGKF